MSSFVTRTCKSAPFVFLGVSVGRFMMTPGDLWAGFAPVAVAACACAVASLWIWSRRA